MDEETKIRTARSATVQMRMPDGSVKDMYAENHAIYLKTGKDVDSLLQVMATGAQFVTEFVLPDGGIPVVIVQQLVPAKIQTIKGLDKK